MLYLFVDRNRIKLLYLKKVLLSQYESAYYEKVHQVNLLKESGEIASADYLASAIKEALTAISDNPIKEKGICLILPHAAFHFLRTEVPPDIAPTALSAFLSDKVRAAFPTDTDNLMSDALYIQNESGKQIIYFGLQREIITQFEEVFSLINLTIQSILPESMMYYKLFEKTLRQEKKEHILYITSEKKYLGGYLYDSYGPLEDKKCVDEHLSTSSSVETILKKVAESYEKQGKKINRIILSGENSDEIRQDTFTKNVGVWTNPLKRIIPDFYQDYVKILITDPARPLPFLQFDVCLGAFIFSVENKSFSLMKQSATKIALPGISLPSIKFAIPVKALGLFALSFAVSFGIWMIATQPGLLPKIPSINTQKPAVPTPTMIASSPTPTATPTPALDRTTVRIKVLNGSGIRGKASEVKEVLNTLGYQEILTGNADAFNYETTEIQIAEGKSEEGTLLTQDLAEYVEKPALSDLTEDTSADIIIIIGTDFR